MKNDRIPPNPHPVKPPPNMPEPRKESLEAENARLKAEVERLRKAGDAMADFFVPDIDDLGHNYGFKKSVESVISNWNAAKEGKQS